MSYCIEWGMALIYEIMAMVYYVQMMVLSTHKFSHRLQIPKHEIASARAFAFYPAQVWS